MGWLGEAIERREKITPGPWTNGYGDGSGVPDGREGGTINSTPEAETVINGGQDDWGVRLGVKRYEDAEFIASMPETFDKLVGLLEQAEAGLLAQVDAAYAKQPEALAALSAIREARGA